MNAQKTFSCIETTQTLTSSLQKIGKDQWIGKQIFYYPSIDSTNTEAKRKLKEPVTNGSVFLADHQTHGKGRAGRKWITAQHTSVACSILLYPPTSSFPVSLLTHLTAAAIYKTLSDYTPLQIKWPNDLISTNKKLGGILIETSYSGAKLEGIIIGAGINLFSHIFDDTDLRSSAISLEDVTKKAINVNVVVGTFLAHFQNMYDSFIKTNNRAFIQTCRIHSSIVGKKIQVKSEFSTKVAFAEDISEEGELIVRWEKDNKKTFLQTGEVSVRGLKTYT